MSTTIEIKPIALPGNWRQRGRPARPRVECERCHKGPPYCRCDYNAKRRAARADARPTAELRDAKGKPVFRQWKDEVKPVTFPRGRQECPRCRGAQFIWAVNVNNHQREVMNCPNCAANFAPAELITDTRGREYDPSAKSRRRTAGIGYRGPNRKET